MQWRGGGLGGLFKSKKLVLNEYEICLKLLEMAILRLKFSNISGEHIPRPPRKLAPSALVVAPPPPPYESLGSAPGTALVFVEDRINLFDNMFKNLTLSFPLKEYYKEISPLKCHWSEIFYFRFESLLVYKTWNEQWFPLKKKFCAFFEPKSRKKNCRSWLTRREPGLSFYTWKSLDVTSQDGHKTARRTYRT